MDIKNCFDKIKAKIGVFGVKQIARRKSKILKEVIDNPENFKLEAYIEGEEIIVKIKKKES